MNGVRIGIRRTGNEAEADAPVVRNKKVEWGVLGVADIAVKRVIPAMQHGEWSQVVAIASRDLKKAQQAVRFVGN